MPNPRKSLVAAIAATAVLAVVAPGASAEVPFGLGPANSPVGNGAGLIGLCGRNTPEGQGGTGAVAPQICQGAGLVFMGPSVGQITSVIGPTIIGPTVIGNVGVGAGNVAVGG